MNESPKHFPSDSLDAKTFIQAADVNNDGVLTFAEFAWQLSKQMTE